MYAIVPAAGHSVRMGADKLLLDWNRKSLIEHHLDAWLESETDRVVVVTRPTATRLIEKLRQYGQAIDLIIPQDDPADMKKSVQVGLMHVRTTYQPLTTDAWLLAPADMPMIGREVINSVCAAHVPSKPRIVVPTYGGEKGHPVLFPWAYYDDVFALSPDQGLNTLTGNSEPLFLEVSHKAILQDIDTPEDYQQMLTFNRHRPDGA